jgi:hypothetical protein
MGKNIDELVLDQLCCGASNYVVSLEVLMGEGNHARSANIYDARELIASIRAKF